MALRPMTPAIRSITSCHGPVSATISYLNRTLCCTRCNQQKRGRTPNEWFAADKTPEDWEKFVSGFESLKEMKGLKKRNFRLKDAGR